MFYMYIIKTYITYLQQKPHDLILRNFLFVIFAHSPPTAGIIVQSKVPKNVKTLLIEFRTPAKNAATYLSKRIKNCYGNKMK